MVDPVTTQRQPGTLSAQMFLLQCIESKPCMEAMVSYQTYVNVLTAFVLIVFYTFVLYTSPA